MSEPLAFLLTWTCYGTWLHGDERGSVTNDGNVPGTPCVGANPCWSSIEAQKLVPGALTLDRRARQIVRDAILDHCRHREWNLHALNVRTNHVHAVLAYDGKSTPEFMLTSLKARTTRCLREARQCPANTRVWTRHGSTRYLWKPCNLDAALAYVLDAQGTDQRFAAVGDP